MVGMLLVSLRSINQGPLFSPESIFQLGTLEEIIIIQKRTHFSFLARFQPISSPGLLGPAFALNSGWQLSLFRFMWYLLGVKQGSNHFKIGLLLRGLIQIFRRACPILSYRSSPRGCRFSWARLSIYLVGTICFWEGSSLRLNHKLYTTLEYNATINGMGRSPKTEKHSML